MQLFFQGRGKTGHQCRQFTSASDLWPGLWINQGQVESLRNEVFKIMVQRHQA